MRFSDYLTQEWKPALGCTEPACIAYAASLAASQSGGKVTQVHLRCDPRIYKNCYAVGIPHSDHRTGILWSVAIGALIPDPSLKLECFRLITPEILGEAGKLIDSGNVTVQVDPTRNDLLADCHVTRGGQVHRVVIEHLHTRVTEIEKNGEPQDLPAESLRAVQKLLRRELVGVPLKDLIDMARAITPSDRGRLREGVAMNLAIAKYGLGMFPGTFRDEPSAGTVTRAGQAVSAGVFARMSGEDFLVMSLSGSGNKGITMSVPLAMWAEHVGAPQDRIDEALALGCLITSLTTEHLGTLSAVCGCSNAAGIGLGAALVVLEGGGEPEISLVINNMVGNVTGMVCDGAKIGCALKTMTAVDAAFRASAFAKNGVGIPASDGIVGADGLSSLENLGRIATRGMTSVDHEILSIMDEKLRAKIAS